MPVQSHRRGTGRTTVSCGPATPPATSQGTPSPARHPARHIKGLLMLMLPNPDDVTLYLFPTRSVARSMAIS